MITQFEYLSHETWSVYATLNIVPLFLCMYYLGNINLQSMVMMSLIGMMKGTIAERFLFSIFLCAIMPNKPKSLWVRNSMIYVIYASLLFYSPKNTHAHIAIKSNYVAMTIFRLIIIIWMFYILQLLVGK